MPEYIIKTLDEPGFMVVGEPDCRGMKDEKRELIRCKDCKHWDEFGYECKIKRGWFPAQPDWFCADGERK